MKGEAYLKKNLFPICYIAEIVFLTHNYQSVLAECEKHFRG